MKFWDREKEKEWLKRYLKSEPNAILFVYGPKSSGKSTLLYQAVKELSKRKWFLQKYGMYWYDLRGKMISSYRDVVDVFFRTEDTEAGRFISSVEREVDIGLPVLASFKVKASLKNEFYSKLADPFEYMEAVLRKSRKKHVIVFDELQKLKEVYINGENQRPVVKELFNFFVRLTKVLHLSHVIVMSSDTFFIEEVYNDSTLVNTSRYFLVDYFDNETTQKILEDEGFSKKDAKEMAKLIGGVPWIIEEVIKDGRETLNSLYREVKGNVREIMTSIYEQDEKIYGLVVEFLKKIISEGKGKLLKEDRKVAKILVEKELLFYDPLDGDVRFQTELHRRVADELLKSGEI